MISVQFSLKKESTTHLVEAGNLLESADVFIFYGPLPKQHLALIPHQRVGKVSSTTDTQTLEKHFVGKCTLKPRASILDQTIEKGESTKLAVNVAILELLSNSPGSFCGTSGLKLDSLHKIRDPTQVIFLKPLTRELLDSNGDGGVGFLLVNGL